MSSFMSSLSCQGQELLGMQAVTGNVLDHYAIEGPLGGIKEAAGEYY